MGADFGALTVKLRLCGCDPWSAWSPFPPLLHKSGSSLRPTSHRPSLRISMPFCTQTAPFMVQSHQGIRRNQRRVNRYPPTNVDGQSVTEEVDAILNKHLFVSFMEMRSPTFLKDQVFGLDDNNDPLNNQEVLFLADGDQCQQTG